MGNRLTPVVPAARDNASFAGRTPGVSSKTDAESELRHRYHQVVQPRLVNSVPSSGSQERTQGNGMSRDRRSCGSSCSWEPRIAVQLIRANPRLLNDERDNGGTE
jgi:hypothetical protein